MVIIERYHRPLLKLTKGKTINKGNKIRAVETVTMSNVKRPHENVIL